MYLCRWHHNIGNMDKKLLACHVSNTGNCKIHTNSQVLPKEECDIGICSLFFPKEECTIHTRTNQSIPKRRVYPKGVCISLKRSIFVHRLGLHEWYCIKIRYIDISAQFITPINLLFLQWIMSISLAHVRGIERSIYLCVCVAAYVYQPCKCEN